MHSARPEVLRGLLVLSLPIASHTPWMMIGAKPSDGSSKISTRLHVSPLGRLQLQQFGVGVLRTQRLGLGEQRL